MCYNKIHITSYYSVTETLNSTYTWTVTGGNILSGAGTDSIKVEWITYGNQTVSVYEKTEDGCYGDTTTINIRVYNVNQPTANAGNDTTVLEGDLITLDGSGSSDPNSDDLSYSWKAPTEITLSDNTAEKPTFTAPLVSQATDFIITLVVDDGTYKSFADTIIITVTRSAYPLAGM